VKSTRPGVGSTMGLSKAEGAEVGAGAEVSGSETAVVKTSLSGTVVGGETDVGAGVSGSTTTVVEASLIADTAATTAFWTISWIAEVTLDASCPVMFICAKSAARLSEE
jgi:hypothetical protein